MAIAYLDWSLDADCPNCKETVDCTEQDADGDLARFIFSNEWGRCKGYEIKCPDCGTEFLLSEIEY